MDLPPLPRRPSGRGTLGSWRPAALTASPAALAACLALICLVGFLAWRLAARPAAPLGLAWTVPSEEAPSPSGVAPWMSEGTPVAAGGGGAAPGGGAQADASERGASRFGPYAGRGEGTAGGIVVDVEGAVASPGPYVLPEDARVWDAIAAAGGTTDDADTRGINLARLVADGELLYVPRRGEVPPVGSGRGAPGEGMGGGGGGAGGERPPGRVDLNHATAAQLELLPGIGPALADRIVRARAEGGPFASLDDLADRVAGIGPKSVERLAPYVVIR